MTRCLAAAALLLWASAVQATPPAPIPELPDPSGRSWICRYSTEPTWPPHIHCIDARAVDDASRPADAPARPGLWQVPTWAYPETASWDRVEELLRNVMCRGARDCSVLFLP